MKRIDEHHMAMALAGLVLDFAFAVLARMRASESLDIASAMALKAAFPVSAFAGLLFRFFPHMKKSRLASPSSLP